MVQKDAGLKQRCNIQKSCAIWNSGISLANQSSFMVYNTQISSINYYSLVSFSKQIWTCIW